MAKIIETHIDQLTPDDHNFNKGTQYGSHLMEESLRKFGGGRSIVLDKNNRIIAGNKTIETAGQIGMERIVVVETTGNEIVAVKRTDIDLDTTKGREMALADNATGKANLDFDTEQIDIMADQFDFDPSDWGIEIESLDVAPGGQQEATDDDFDPEQENIIVRCKPGDVWVLGDHRLMCGDSISLDDVKTLLGGVKSVDMLMTDPPYGISADKMQMGTGKQDYQRGDWDATRPDIVPLLKYAKYSCVWGGNYFADVLPVNNDWLCWHKNNDGLSFSEFELAWTNFGRNCRHITHHWGKEKKLHITMKPLEVIGWAIQQAKEDCHTIMDLFGGSGTTLIACEQLGKQCYMMERDPHFCDVILTRWEKATGMTAKKA